MWKWQSLEEAAHQIVEDGFQQTNARYVFFALKNHDTLNVIATQGGPLPKSLETATQIPLLWQNKVFGVLGKTRNTKNWSEDWLAQISFILGALWFSAHCNHVQEKFLSTIAHEVKNPLTGILNTVDLLLGDTTHTTVEQKHIQTIEENASYLLSLSNDLLELHKIKMNMSQANPISVDLRMLLSTVSSMCGNFLVIKVSVHKAVPKQLLFDEVKFKQILINLIQNSKKFSATTIHIRAAWKEKDETLYLEIEDNGTGIAPENIPKLFHFGFSTSGSIGLGLSLSKSLLYLMKGHIYVKQSQLGCSTTMAFYLQAPTANLPSSPSLSLSHSPPHVVPLQRVLVVDDHVSVRITVTEMLKKLLPNMFVDMAMDGVDAVKQYVQFRHQLIFLDLRMPNLDGWGCAAQLRQLGEPWPIIFVISAYNLTEAEKGKCRDLGVAGFIKKPFKTADLKMLLQKAKFLSS